ncbi:DDE-type integrase/transposase/recombinase [Streptomyces sp. NBC_01017]|uniref:DDE-type integrase/transposase/recombinase n=1 Tax=Streptomyces sp. NBC_01017 TaxID=2903721 RepID=UPI003866FD24
MGGYGACIWSPWGRGLSCARKSLRSCPRWAFACYRFAGVVYVTFVVDTFSRRIVGWSLATSKETRLVLDALEIALWQRDRDQRPFQKGQLIHHSDAGSQYTSFALVEHLERAGIAASIGSVDDAYENALMESTIDLFKQCRGVNTPPATSS